VRSGAFFPPPPPLPGRANHPFLSPPQDRFDEAGDIALPPGLWGSAAEGLAPPITLPFNATLRSEKLNNATYGHYGEMASWQMRGIIV